MGNFLGIKWRKIGRKISNFSNNIWDKGKTAIVAGVGTVGTAVGSAIGFPALGGVAAAALNQIPTETQLAMKRKIKEQGVIKKHKIVDTMMRHNVVPTYENVEAVTESAKAQVFKETGKMPATTSDNAITHKWYKKVLFYAKKYWYVVLGVVATVLYFVFGNKSNSKGRRR